MPKSGALRRPLGEPRFYRGAAAAYATLTPMLKLLFWLFVLFLALSYFGISIQSIVNSPAGQQNLAYLAYLVITGVHWLLNHVPGYIQQLETASSTAA